ncbi:hypothetical protein NMY22_g4671 [Coprinellus aureogranulatus]|nr:hypothetical protein NMY22_g4671 [Coprinellus aureogranulatus]
MISVTTWFFFTKLVPAGTPLRLWGDNEGVIKAWRNCWSRNATTNGVFQLALDFLEENGFDGCVYTSYVQTKQNPADSPSRHIYPSTQLLLPPVSVPPDLSPYLVNTTSATAGSFAYEDPPSTHADGGGEQCEGEDGLWPSSEDDMAALTDTVAGDGGDDIDV